MTYEETSAEWVRRRFNEVGEIDSVDFENGHTRGGCDTCGHGEYDYVEVWYRLNGYSKYQEIPTTNLTQIVRELIEIASAQLP